MIGLMSLCIKVNGADNVAVAVQDLPRDTEICDVESQMKTLEFIPRFHKIALRDIPESSAVIRYGIAIGFSKYPIKKGQHVSETMLHLPPPVPLDEMKFAVNIVKDLPIPPVLFWEGYKEPNSSYGGTKNILAINTTVQCVTGIVNLATAKIKSELLPKYPNVDDVVPINHAYGCGVAINATDAQIPIRTLQNIAKHPNFGSQIMLVGLGCEKLTVEMFLEKKDNNPENVLILHDCNGFDAMIDAMMKMAEAKLKILDKRSRQLLPLSDLMIGLQCGASDALSGITANPAAGYASDMLVKAGATVLFSEVTEVRDGCFIIAERCINEEVGKRFMEEMKWYDDYLKRGDADRSANPTPGNKNGGLSNIAEKAMGSITKSGTSPIVEVLSPAEIPTKKGLVYAATPASDIVCGPCQLASGIGVQVFMTGAGTPYGLAGVPVIKVSSNNEIKKKWPDLIDINAGPIAVGEATIPEIGNLLYKEIIEIASGRKKCLADKHKIYNDLCVFNPAPIT